MRIACYFNFAFLQAVFGEFFGPGKSNSAHDWPGFGFIDAAQSLWQATTPMVLKIRAGDPESRKGHWQ
jgi:hypothetical protein